jgi:hypothetical protein
VPVDAAAAGAPRRGGSGGSGAAGGGGGGRRRRGAEGDGEALGEARRGRAQAGSGGGGGGGGAVGAVEGLPALEAKALLPAAGVCVCVRACVCVCARVELLPFCVRVRRPKIGCARARVLWAPLDLGCGGESRGKG